MLEAVTKLGEWLLKLAEQRRAREQLVFERYVEPLFHEAQVVYANIVDVLLDIDRQLQTGKSISEIIDELERARRANKPLRDKIRAIIEQHCAVNVHMTRFEEGILNVLRGGLSQLEDDREDHDMSRVVYPTDHAIADILRHMRARERWRIITFQPRATAAKEARSHIARQLEALESAWNETVRGYAELQNQYVTRGVSQ